MIVLAGTVMLAHLTGISAAFVAALLTAVTEGGMALLIFLAAGGYGYLLIRKLAPSNAPTALRVFTACGLGLWALATLVLIVGSSFTGALNAWVFWCVVAGGVILAAWFAQGPIEAWKMPRRFDGTALMWVVLAIAGGIWIAGATRPAGMIHTSDSYDVLEYHLQVPREFHHAGRIGELQHNCYSYYPLQTEMLFLLGMALRGGAYEGMYVGKFIHGMFGVLAVGAIFGSLKRDEESRGRFAAVLLGTVPFVVYLSWVAMVELAMLLYAAVALLWVREWLRDRSQRSALCVGLMLGASCAVKYLSVGLVLAPVLIAMAVLSVLMRERIKQLLHLPLVALAALVLFSPWLIRNTVYTGNPVFPLGTDVFGPGHWSEVSAQRWRDGHGPQMKPPVPIPPGWKSPPVRSRPELLYDNLVTAQEFGPVLLLLTGIAICVLIARGLRDRPWDLALTIVLLVQIAVWMGFTHGAPKRFGVVALVPMALLAGGVLAGLARVQTNPFRRGAVGPVGVPWGRRASIALLGTALLVNLWIGYWMYRQYTLYGQYPSGQPRMHGNPGEFIAQSFWNDPNAETRLMLLGDAKGFYFPPETIYATTFDSHPLAPIARKLIDNELTPQDALDEIHRMGVTHIWVDWWEILRLANTYGFPPSLSKELIERRKDDRPAGLAVFEKLSLRITKQIELPQPTTVPTTQPQRRPWPWVSVYALPWAPTTKPTTSHTVPGSEPDR